VSQARVTALECPVCRGPLRGLRHDVLFGCSACDLAVYIDDGDRRAFRVRFAAAEVDEPGPRIHLPIWEVLVRVDVPAPDRDRARLASLAREIERVWVVGFRARHPSLFDDPGLELSERRFEARDDPHPPSGAPLVGACRGPAVIARSAELYVLDFLDRRADVTDLAVDVGISRAQLWAVPFVDKEGRLRELLTGTSLPDHVFEDLPEIRAELARDSA